MMPNTMTVESYIRRPYAREITPDPSGGYAAEIREFPGCFAQGDSPEEAYQNLERAARAWIAASLDEGRSIPEPVDDEGYSGRLALRLPRTLHRRIAHKARVDGTSINQQVVSAVACWIGADDARRAITEYLAVRMPAMVWVSSGAMIAPTAHFDQTGTSAGAPPLFAGLRR